jgi:hypothetical protein
MSAEAKMRELPDGLPAGGKPLSRREMNRLGEQILRDDSLRMNEALARLGHPYRQLRNAPTHEIVTYLDKLTEKDRGEHGIEIYLGELQRREQAKTNRLIIWLGGVATIAGCIQASPVVVMLWQHLFGG